MKFWEFSLNFIWNRIPNFFFSKLRPYLEHWPFSEEVPVPKMDQKKIYKKIIFFSNIELAVGYTGVNFMNFMSHLRSTFSLKHFYPTTYNLKKFFDFTNFWRIAGPKTKLVDFRAKFPLKMAIIARLSHLSW